MGVRDLPETFEAWQKMREEHLYHNLQQSMYTKDLFKQYCKHLGFIRYRLLLEGQMLVVPERVRELLGFRKISLLKPVLSLYKISRFFNADWLLKAIILPPDYKDQIKSLDRLPT